jgi:basic membrane lipoprotein Med (substrate-binding protein (PBP1-ABC) superfamily)
MLIRAVGRCTAASTLALSIAVLVACGGNTTPAPASGAALRVALLTPGPISDQSWNGSAYAGLQRIKDSLGADVSHIQTKTPAEFEENFRQYGAQGYDLVFGHGFEFQDAAMRVAPQFPKTVFVTTSGNQVAANVAGMNFAFEEASYLAGMMAGAVTKSGVLGCIGGTELPPVKASFLAFEAGAKRVRPNIKVLVSYLGNWDDVSAGKEQALAQIGRGADVIFQNADAAGLGVFQAARESRKAYVVGSNSNQNGVAPDVVLGSVIIDIPHALLIVAREVKAKTFKPRVVEFGMADDVVSLTLNDRLASVIPPAARAGIDSVKQQVIAGTFRTPGSATLPSAKPAAAPAIPAPATSTPP